jgi:hypothetical protein
MDADEIKEEIAHQQALIKEYRKHLRELELQSASFGAIVPTHIQIERDKYISKINACERSIENLIKEQSKNTEKYNALILIVNDVIEICELLRGILDDAGCDIIY